ncbi:MAG: hypothetical protein U1E76_12815 [Planctomycetota bacterium]
MRFAAAHLAEDGRALLQTVVRRDAPDLAVMVTGLLHGAVARARLALVTSGTATMEVALMGTPLCVFYKVSRLELWLSRLLLTVPHIAQVNLVRGKRAFPEFLVARPDHPAIAAQALALYQDGEPRTTALAELAELRRQMGLPGASERAAASVLGFLSSRE